MFERRALEYYEGRNCRFLGDPLDSNPYVPYTPETRQHALDWTKGWTDEDKDLAGEELEGEEQVK